MFFLFIFIGFVLALVQGGFVRRKARDIGEKKLAVFGILLSLPGLLILGRAESTLALYAGLFFLACGSAIVIPCLTSLVSLYSPSDAQGKGLGIFRSLGALGRVFGPAAAGLLYWRYGSGFPYYVGAMFLIIPAVLLSFLPTPKYDEVEA